MLGAESLELGLTSQSSATRVRLTQAEDAAIVDALPRPDPRSPDPLAAFTQPHTAKQASDPGRARAAGTDPFRHPIDGETQTFQRQDHETAGPIVVVREPMTNAGDSGAIVDDKTLHEGAQVSVHAVGQRFGHFDALTQRATDPKLGGTL